MKRLRVVLIAAIDLPLTIANRKGESLLDDAMGQADNVQMQTP